MGKAVIEEEANETGALRVHRGIGDGMLAKEFCSNTGSPVWCLESSGNELPARARQG